MIKHFLLTVTNPVELTDNDIAAAICRYFHKATVRVDVYPEIPSPQVAAFDAQVAAMQPDERRKVAQLDPTRNLYSVTMIVSRSPWAAMQLGGFIDGVRDYASKFGVIVEDLVSRDYCGPSPIAADAANARAIRDSHSPAEAEAAETESLAHRVEVLEAVQKLSGDAKLGERIAAIEERLQRLDELAAPREGVVQLERRLNMLAGATMGEGYVPEQFSLAERLKRIENEFQHHFHNVCEGGSTTSPRRRDRNYGA